MLYPFFHFNRIHANRTGYYGKVNNGASSYRDKAGLTCSYISKYLEKGRKGEEKLYLIYELFYLKGIQGHVTRETSVKNTF